MEIDAGSSVATCEYCGTQQTLPKIDDDRRANLYDRANHFRRNNEFDKAMGLYEQILTEDPTDAESYWSLVLCRYGIEYVEDPTTHRRVPTVNRAQYTSIFDDDNYRSALQYADAAQRQLYEQEAKTINEIQKGILAISQKEEPFDVFICYKETDTAGRRTPDSVLATELYQELTRDGFRVFFSRITLEDKLGTAYEPYIFAALHSAKVMVVLGTKPEYFNAVWVKNEWSRYLALIRAGEKKTLIPAYRDMDPYDLPEEFSHLQALDMAKLGFMQDLVRGIRKITAAEAPAAATTEKTVVKESGSNVSALLRRAFLFLEDGDWASADEYCEKVLDLDPETPRAYLGKLMAELHVHKEDQLIELKQPFDGLANYQKTMRFADEALRNQLQSTVEQIKERNRTNTYQHLLADGRSKMQEAQKLIADYDKKAVFHATNIIQQRVQEALDAAIKAFTQAEQYGETPEELEQCTSLRQTFQNQVNYDRALAQMDAKTMSLYREALKTFEQLADFQDSAAQAAICRQRIAELEEQEKRNTEERQIAAEKNKKILKKVAIIIAAIALVVVVVVLIITVILPGIPYVRGMRAEKNGNFQEALAAYEEAGDFRDAKEKYAEVQNQIAYNEGVAAEEAGNLREALAIYWDLEEYQDSQERAASVLKTLVPKTTIETGLAHTIAIKSDGTVVAVGLNNDGRCNTSGWTDIISVSAGGSHSVGLKSDGTVVAAGYNGSDQCEVSGWTDIIAISAGDRHTVGLKSDGTVVAVGYNADGRCNVFTWTNIIAISARDRYTVGLKSDGTVVTVGSGSNYDGMTDWTDIIAISAGNSIVGLKSDRTVVASGYNYYGQNNVSNWTDIIAVSAGYWHTVGLRSNGIVVATGYNEDGRCNVSDWTDIVAIAAGYYHTVGLKSDGTVIAVGDNSHGQCDISSWQDIMMPDAISEE